MTDEPLLRASLTQSGADPVADLERRVDELTAALAARDSFIAVAAHELRNPMTPLLGQVEAMLFAVRTGRFPPGQVEERLERIHLSVLRFWKRAGVLLDVSRINNGKFRPEPEAFDFAALLREVALTYAEAARRAEVPLKVVADESLPGTWDRLAVEQIIDNLLSNALKYGGRTPIEISAEASGSHVQLRVRDHGGGISPDQRDRLFGRFERAVGNGDRRTGFGIGLWLVRQLAEAMDGEIAVEDAPGGGALFTVTLPTNARGTGC